MILAGLLAFKKALLVGIAAIGAYLRKLFGKKDDSDTVPQAPAEPGA